MRVEEVFRPWFFYSECVRIGSGCWVMECGSAKEHVGVMFGFYGSFLIFQIKNSFLFLPKAVKSRKKSAFWPIYCYDFLQLL